jgi:hypothetical protein
LSIIFELIPNEHQNKHSIDIIIYNIPMVKDLDLKKKELKDLMEIWQERKM